MALPEIVQSSLTDYFRMVQSEVHQFTAPLSTEQIWRKPYPYGNSIGNLILHLSGNFNYYIGTQLAGTEYVRHRPREFTDTGQPKEDLIRDFDAATEIAVTTIARQSADDWTQPYEAENEPESHDRFTLFFRCAAHAYHHVGQIIYLQRELLKQS
jgi:hypothetical protein